ncbi:SAP domain-containing protein [Ditylenchus destructor]|nr:SAP domain-containing protein [Ditylenchus destructor]
MLTGRQGRRSGTGELNPAVIGLFTVDRLRKELESRGLNSTGNKSALEERLLEAIKSGKTVFSPDASVSTAAVAIKAEIIETEETPPARKRGRKRKAQIVRKSLQLGGKSKLNWATKPPVEALQKAFDPSGDTASPDTKPPVEALQKAFDPSGDTASPDTKPPLMNETAPSIPPPQLPKPTQPPPIKAQRETISPDVKVPSVSGKAPSTIRPPPKPAQSAKPPTDLPETIIAKQDETLVSKYKSEEAKFVEKKRFEPERRRASGLEHIGLGPMEPPRRIQEKRPISRDTVSPDVKVLSVSRKAPSVIRPPVPLPKPAPSAKQPIDLLETIIAKQDETLASKYKSEKVKFEEKTRFELERRRASGLEHIGFGPMEPPRRIQEKRPISSKSRICCTL